MCRRVAALAPILLFFAVVATIAQDDTPTEQTRKYRHGVLRLGAFAVTNLDTTVVARSDVAPLGVYLDLTRDLGLKDSATIPRVLFAYRFSRRHQMDIDWFAINRSASKSLERDIEFPPGNVVTLGVRAELESNVSVYKALYTWLFYDRDKVTLGASFGLNVVDFDLGIRVSTVNLPGDSIDEVEGVTAPLPTIGFRLIYRATPKLGLGFTADLLAIDYSDFTGVLQDIFALVEYRPFKIFGFGAGINTLSFNFKFDNDDALAELRNNYRGFIGFVSFHF